MTAGNAFPLSSNYQMLNTGRQLIHTYQERSSLFLTPSDHARVLPKSHPHSIIFGLAADGIGRAIDRPWCDLFESHFQMWVLVVEPSRGGQAFRGRLYTFLFPCGVERNFKLVLLFARVETALGTCNKALAKVSSKSSQGFWGVCPSRSGSDMLRSRETLI